MNLSGKIVFSSGKAGDYDIWKLDLASEELTQLTEGTFWNDAPKWSPDGARIAYISNAEGIPQVWLMDADGKNKQKVTESTRMHATPAWHPDGDSLLVSANYKGNLDIFQISLEGEIIKQLTDYEGKDSTPQFSPDGKKIVFTSQSSGNDDIWQYEVASGSLTQLTKSPAQDFSPCYSPDGLRIAFVSGRFMTAEASLKGGLDVKAQANLDIFLMDANGDNVERITKNKGSDRYVVFSPDGKYLLYASSSYHGEAGRLTVMDLEKRKQESVKLDRTPLEDEIDSNPQNLFTHNLSKMFARLVLPKSFHGSERYPDWTR